MGVEKLPREKINVRSPFFVTVDSEGAPDLLLDCPVDVPETSTDPVVIPTPTDPVVIPEEYQQPPAKTENVYCGDVIKIGTDVGVRRYVLEVGDVTGNVTIDYTVNVPVSITGFWNTTVPDFSSTGYVGNDLYEQDLLDAGISASGMNLGSGAQTGTVTVNKTAASPSVVTILVSAPLPTDDYSITFNCPSAPAIVPDPTPPVSQVLPDPGNSKLIENIPVWGLGQQNFPSTIKLEVNGTLVSSSLDFRKLYYFSDYDPEVELGMNGGTGQMRAAVDLPDYSSAVRFSKSTYFVEGVNEIVFTITAPQGDGSAIRNFKFFRSGVLYAYGQWEYAEPRASAQLGHQVGRFPRGINTVNHYKYNITHSTSTKNYTKLSPVKVKFYYDTGATFSGDNSLIVRTEGLVAPTKYYDMNLTNWSTAMAGYEIRNGFYYTEHARGDVRAYNLAPYGRTSEIK